MLTIFGVIFLVTLARNMHMASLEIQTLQQWDLGFRKVVFLRLDSLMYGVFGAWLATVHPALWRRQNRPVFWLGLGLLLMDFSLSHLLFWRDYLSLSITPMANLLMLPFLSEWKKARYRILHILTFFSIISYSLYLVHLSLVQNNLLPILNKHFDSEYLSTTSLVLLYWGLSIALACLCRRFVEVPFIAFRDTRGITRVAPSSAR